MQQVLLGAASETALVHRAGGRAAALALRSLERRLWAGVQVRVSRKRMQELPLLQPPQQLPCRPGRSQLKSLLDTHPAPTR